MNDETIKIFVGADRSQQLAIKVLEHSIKKNTNCNVDIIPMIDLETPIPNNPKNWQRTGFSYSRFCIPALAGYSGRAIYMDADMQVFGDIKELWDIPMNGAKVVIQKEVKHTESTLQKTNAPSKRPKQSSVMILDCSALKWDVNTVIKGLNDNTYDYEQLMYELCILNEDEINYSIPFEWNSLEHYDKETKLIHYTDMGTQPWVSANNSNGFLWFSEVKEMINEGLLSINDLKNEISCGHFRPSLINDIRYNALSFNPIKGFLSFINNRSDSLSGFTPHKAVYELKRKRISAIKEHKLTNI